MNDNTDETFTRTAPPLTRFVVKLGGPAPWEILKAADARRIGDRLLMLHPKWETTVGRLYDYADAVDAMTRPERDMVTTDEELFF